jgi:transcriptional regulator with XRE-family HTH domain
MDFAEAILDLRTVLRISQEQLAKELDVSYATINRWENGRTLPNRMTINAIKHYCEKRSLEFTYESVKNTV